MEPDELKIGSLYRIKKSVTIKVCNDPMRYTGIDSYFGEDHHSFWNTKWKLVHWINPEDVEPYEIPVHDL